MSQPLAVLLGQCDHDVSTATNERARLRASAVDRGQVRRHQFVIIRDAAMPSLAQADRASRDASVTLGLTLPGDTVLYLLLPLHASVFGVTLPEAGLLLAANRLVRIAGYGWVARGYHRFGPRAAFERDALIEVVG